MLSIIELQDFLVSNEADFDMISHDTPIISTKDAAQYFDINKAVPVIIIDTEQTLLACMVGATYGKINLKEMGQSLGCSKFRMASAEKIQRITGYDIGSIPLIGHQLPCIFDQKLLEYDYIYGGTGDLYHTLKITPKDTIQLNNVIHMI